MNCNKQVDTMESKTTTESNASKNMFSVVQKMNAGYEKFFDSKPKTSAIRSECYSTTSTNVPKQYAEITDGRIDPLPVSNNCQNAVQQFFPRGDEIKQCQRINNGSGCSKYPSVNNEK